MEMVLRVQNVNCAWDRISGQRIGKNQGTKTGNYCMFHMSHKQGAVQTAWVGELLLKVVQFMPRKVNRAKVGEEGMGHWVREGGVLSINLRNMTKL